jgi:hypothetical protein
VNESIAGAIAQTRKPSEGCTANCAPSHTSAMRSYWKERRQAGRSVCCASCSNGRDAAGCRSTTTPSNPSQAATTTRLPASAVSGAKPVRSQCSARCCERAAWERCQPDGAADERWDDFQVIKCTHQTRIETRIEISGFMTIQVMTCLAAPGCGSPYLL